VCKIARRGAAIPYGVKAILRTPSAFRTGSFPEATFDVGTPQSAGSKAFFKQRWKLLCRHSQTLWHNRAVKQRRYR
jgi:hypothetical protein